MGTLNTLEYHNRVAHYGWNTNRKCWFIHVYELDRERLRWNILFPSEKSFKTPASIEDVVKTLKFFCFKFDKWGVRWQLEEDMIWDMYGDLLKGRDKNA